MTRMVDMILAGQADQFIQTFEQAMTAKASEEIQNEKIFVAQNMFARQEFSEEDYSEE